MKIRKFRRQSSKKALNNCQSIQCDEEFYGFRTERDPNEPMQIFPDEEPCCIVRRVDQQTLKQFFQENLTGFQVGDWYLSCGTDHHYKVTGPFKSMESAFNHAYEHLQVARFLTLPTIGE